METLTIIVPSEFSIELIRVSFDIMGRLAGFAVSMCFPVPYCPSVKLHVKCIVRNHVELTSTSSV